MVQKNSTAPVFSSYEWYISDFLIYLSNDHLYVCTWYTPLE